MHEDTCETGYNGWKMCVLLVDNAYWVGGWQRQFSSRKEMGLAYNAGRATCRSLHMRANGTSTALYSDQWVLLHFTNEPSCDLYINEDDETEKIETDAHATFVPTSGNWISKRTFLHSHGTWLKDDNITRTSRGHPINKHLHEHNKLSSAYRYSLTWITKRIFASRHSRKNEPHWFIRILFSKKVCLWMLI